MDEPVRRSGSMEMLGKRGIFPSNVIEALHVRAGVGAAPKSVGEDGGDEAEDGEGDDGVQRPSRPRACLGDD